METKDRKFYLDNLRWITILVVVVFHIFYYYNDVGAEPMFQGIPKTMGYTFPALFQYGVYQWFMLLLFIVSGICARFTLEKKSTKEFFKDKVNKLLVPSTLGIITIQWVGGYLISLNFMTDDMPIPGLIKYLIMVVSGIGALWFCQVLFVACLILLLIKKMDKTDKLLALGKKANLPVLLVLAVLMIGCSQILNMPMIATYRMCFYPMSFLLGYYVFSHDHVLELLKKWCPLFLVIGVLFGVWYIHNSYGTYYADYAVLKAPVSVIHAYFTAIGLIGLSERILDFHNGFTAYMSKAGWGIYICHINVLLAVNTLLKPVVGSISIWAVYGIELITALFGSILLWEILKRIPVIRWLLFGMKKPKKES